MQASRLLSILMLLQARGRLSAQALAAELEVSVRTIYRDIDELSAAGVPVWAERGRLGGIRLQEGWRTHLTGLTATEAQAIFLGGLPGPAADLGLSEALASAQLKLLAALPAGWQEDAQRISARFCLDPVGWYQSPPPIDHLPLVARAVWTERRLKIRYESWKGVVDREVDPLGLVLKAGVWYMVARAASVSSQARLPRTYRLSSILQSSISSERFRRPRDFDLAACWRESTARFEAELYHGTAVVRVSPRGSRLLKGLSPAVAEAAERTQEPPDEQGWVRVTVPIESIDHAAGQLLTLGTDAEALAPAALRARMAEIASRLAAMYGDS